MADQRGPGRPPKKQRQLNIRLALELADALDEAAVELGMTKTALVERFLREGLNALPSREAVQIVRVEPLSLADDLTEAAAEAIRQVLQKAQGG